MVFCPTVVVATPQPTILVLGDSLSAAYGMRWEEGWVSLLQHRLREQQLPYAVTNASISGETTAGGASRIAGLLAEYTPAIVIVELGGNDGLRGTPLNQIRQNLETIVSASQQAGALVVLVGMQIPPSYGMRYTQRFAAIYPELAKRFNAILVQNFLESVGDSPDLMQSDRIHPTADAQPILLEKVWLLLYKTMR